MTEPPATDPPLGRREFLAASAALPPAAVRSTETGGVSGTEAETPPEPPVEWTFDAGEELSRLYGVTDGIAYLGTRSGVVAVDAEDGSERWRHETDEGRFAWAIPADQGTVLVTNGRARVLDPESGEERWELPTAVSFSVGAGGESMFALRESGLVAHDLRSGEERWSVEVDPPRGQAWADAETVYLRTEDDVIRALRVDDGSERWRFDAGERVDLLNLRVDRASLGPGTTFDRLYFYRTESGALAAHSVEDGGERWRLAEVGDSRWLRGTFRRHGIYVVRDGAAVAYDLDDGRERWRYDPAEFAVGTLTAGGDTVYATGSDRSDRRERGPTTRALDRETGAERWRTGERGVVPGRVVPGATADVVLAGDPEEALYALDPADGSAFWRYEPDGDFGGAPVVSGTTAYVPTRDGTLAALAVPGARSWLDRARDALPGGAELLLAVLLTGIAASVAYRRRFAADDATPPLEALDLSPDALEPVETLAASDDVIVERARVTEDEAERTVVRKRWPDGEEVDLGTWLDLREEAGVLPVLAHGGEPEPWVVLPDRADRSLGAARDRLGADGLLSAVADAAEVVHARHRAGVVHGNLHGDNVFLADGEVRIADWGLRRRNGPERHLAPEQADDEAAADPLTDVYQLGALAERLLSDSETGADAPAAVDDVLARATAADPDERYDSALAFRDALRWAAFVE